MRKKKLEDEEILFLIKKKESKGMKYLMDCYTGLVFYVVEGKLKGYQQDIEECVSDVFIEFYNKVDSIDLEKGNIKTYLATMASRRAIDDLDAANAVEQSMDEAVEVAPQPIERPDSFFDPLPAEALTAAPSVG